MVGECVASLVPNSRVTVLFCVAGFWPGSRAPFVSAKGAKTSDAPTGLITSDGRKPWRASQLAVLKQGSPAHESVLPESRAAGVGPWETNMSGIQIKERGTIHSASARCFDFLSKEWGLLNEKDRTRWPERVMRLAWIIPQGEPFILFSDPLGGLSRNHQDLCHIL